EVKLLLTKLDSQEAVSENKKLRTELLKLQEHSRKVFRETVDSNSEEKIKKRVTEVRGKNEERLCEILKEFGWPTKSLVGADGVSAALFLLQNSASLQFQVNL